MRKWIGDFFKRSFVKNALTVAFGSIIVQTITIVFSPFLTRIYGPEAFGILGIFLSITTIISPVITLTYSTAIILPDKEENAIGLMRISLISSLIISTLILLIIAIILNIEINTYQYSKIINFAYLIPLTIFTTALTQIFNQWLIRRGLYKNIATLSISQSIVMNTSKVGIGLINPSAGALISLSSIDQLILFLQYYFKFPSQVKLIFSGHIPYKKCLKLGAEYKSFPFYRAPQMLFNSLTKGAPILVLAYFFGPIAAGFYSIGNRVMNIPADVIGKSIGSVYYPKIAKAKNNNEDISSYILKATLGMASLAIMPICLIAIFGPMLFGIAFGKEWIQAGFYARWLSILIFSEFILHPAKDAMLVSHYQKVLLYFEIFTFIIKVLSLAIGYYYFEVDTAAIALYSITGMISSSFLLTWVFFIAKWK